LQQLGQADAGSPTLRPVNPLGCLGGLSLVDVGVIADAFCR